MEEFLSLVAKASPEGTDLNIADTFLQCPTVIGSTEFYNAIPTSYYKRHIKENL